MTNGTSPLQKYKRQPKLYIDLPSKGVWYPKDILEKAEDVEVFSMTANDEIALKTPDGLYSGIAVKRLIEHCIPVIKDAWYVPLVDLDYFLAAIRLATYGPSIELTSACSKCENVDTYGLPVQNILDHLQAAEPKYEITINGFTFKLRPLCYKEINTIQQDIFKIRRTIQQNISLMEEGQEKEEAITEIFDQLRSKTVDAICLGITEVVTPEGESESNQMFIKDFIVNNDKEFYNGLEELYDHNRSILAVPQSEVECSACGHKSTIAPDLDYANFFVTS